MKGLTNMTNKEKLEIINKKLEMLYEELNDLEDFTTDAQHNITQAIYNLESSKLLLEPIENNLGLDKPTTYMCPKCKKEVNVYGKLLSGMCYDCNHKLVKKTMQ